MKTETEFNGQDALRLANCIKYASENGLAIDKNTQCGINPNSGNVWLWDEEWPACIYCNISMKTKMLWTCYNCGNEFDVKIGDVVKCECDEFKKDYPEGQKIKV